MELKIQRFELDGVLEITPIRHGDDRGYFSETWNRRAISEAGVNVDFVQDNQSLSVAAGTLRGLHFQKPPFAQAKLIRVLSGGMLDVVVDIRKGSPNFGRWLGVELSSAKWNQLYIPIGFAHGFLTLVPDTAVAYKVSNYYSPEHDRAIRFNDPALGIVWPPELQPYQLSPKDRAAPLLADIDTGFT